MSLAFTLLSICLDRRTPILVSGFTDLWRNANYGGMRRGFGGGGGRVCVGVGSVCFSSAAADLRGRGSVQWGRWLGRGRGAGPRPGRGCEPAAAAPATTCWAAPYPGPARGPHRLGRRGNPTLRRASTAHQCGGRSCPCLGRTGPGGHPPRRRRATPARRGRGTRTEGRRTAPSATSRPSKFRREGTAQGSSCRCNEYADSRPTPASRV